MVTKSLTGSQISCDHRKNPRVELFVCTVHLHARPRFGAEVPYKQTFGKHTKRGRNAKIRRLKAAIEELGDKATAKNIADMLGYSWSWVREVLKEGEKQGYLKKQGRNKPYELVE